MSNYISIYSGIKEIKSTKKIEIFEFLENIQNGYWQDHVLPIRSEKNKNKRRDLKKSVPAVTISGIFEQRRDDKLLQHSGLIAIDIDDLGKDVEKYRTLLSKDPYTFSVFSSISGTGLCLLIKIDSRRHRDAFKSICSYLLDNYDIVVDSSCINESRARFVSYDPYIFVNEKAETYKKYLPKEKKRTLPPPIYVKDDFDRMINEMVIRGVDCTEDYRDWIRTAFSLSDEFGEAGREYFHKLSSISGKYDTSKCDRKYSSALKSRNNSSKRCSIATIYWFAKQSGIKIYSEKTERIIRSSASQKRAGLTDKESIVNSLSVAGLEKKDTGGIVDQILKNNVPQRKEDLTSDLIAFITNMGLKKNLITRDVEWNGKPVNDEDLNSIFLDCKQKFDKSNKDIAITIIKSNRIERYNPIEIFLNNASDIDRSKTPNLNTLLRSINTDTENYQKWVTKWLVSLLATYHGGHSPLTLVFAGEIKGKGKTHFFRYLLPKGMRNLYAESKMDNGKDDSILMTKKWIIMDDEMGGKSKRDSKRFKEITSKEWINVREPYGHVSVDLRRLCMFCGTSNELQILNDSTGNRRYIPIHIIDLDHDIYNDCDKEELLHELEYLYQSGYDYKISGDEIKELNENTDIFKASTPEEELTGVYLSVGDKENNDSEWLTITEISEYLLKFSKRNNLNGYRMGSVLTNIGYEKNRVMQDGIRLVRYFVLKKKETKTYDEAPF